MKNKAIATKKDRYLLYALIAGLSILLILRDVNNISINKFIYFGYAVALMAVANYQTLVHMICFILPLVCGLPGTYIMPCAFMLLVVKRGRIKPIQLVPILLILLLELFAAFWYPSIDFALIVNYIFFAAVMIFLIQDDDCVDCDKCIILYLLGTLLLCYVILSATFASAPRNWMKLFADGQFRIGDQHTDSGAMTLKVNANSLAYYSLVGMACSLLMTERRAGIKKVWYIALTILFVIAGFLTLSRSWLLMAAVCLILYILSKLRNPKQFLTMFLVLFVVGIAISGYLEKNPELLAGFETRFNDETVESGGGRAYIFKNYMEIFFSNIRFVIFGTGVTQYKAAAGYNGSFHNGTQQILVSCGLIGFAVYMIVLFGPVIKANRRKWMPLAYWLPLICVVAFTQTIQFLNPTMLMLPYIIGIYALRAGGQSNENISDNRGHGGGRPVGLEAR